LKPVVDIFAPVFFVYVGAEVNVKLLDPTVAENRPALLLGLLLRQAEQRRQDGNAALHVKLPPDPRLAAGSEAEQFLHRRLEALLVPHRERDAVLQAGLEIVGPDAGEMIQLIGIAVRMKATKADFDATMAVHPTMAEELVTMREKAVTYGRAAAE